MYFTNRWSRELNRRGGGGSAQHTEFGATTSSPPSTGEVTVQNAYSQGGVAHTQVRREGAKRERRVTHASRRPRCCWSDAFGLHQRGPVESASCLGARQRAPFRQPTIDGSRLSAAGRKGRRPRRGFRCARCAVSASFRP